MGSGVRQRHARGRKQHRAGTSGVPSSVTHAVLSSSTTYHYLVNAFQPQALNCQRRSSGNGDPAGPRRVARHGVPVCVVPIMLVPVTMPLNVDVAPPTFAVKLIESPRKCVLVNESARPPGRTMPEMN